MDRQSSVKIAKGFAVIIGATAILVMIGWASDIGFLKSISPSWIAMRPMTAVNFLLTAFILYYIAEDLERRTGIAGIVLPLASFLSATFMLSLLYSDIFGVRTGLEELFVMETGGATQAPVPGRPAVPAIFDFILVAFGGIVTVFHPANLKSVLSWLGGIIAANAAVACVGYLLDVPQLYYRIEGADTVMAFHTAVLFVLFGAGLLLLGGRTEAAPSPPDKKSLAENIKSPVRSLATLMFGLFAIELLAMSTLAVLPSMPAWREILIDATTVVALFFPFLYLLVFRPFRIRDEQQTLARQQIAQSRQEWVATFDAVSDPIFLHDAEFRLVRTNRAYVERAGRPLPEILGLPYWQVFPKSDGPFPHCLDALHAEEGDGEEEICCGPDEIYASRSFALRDRQGAYQASVHIMRDITGQKRMQQALHESEEKFRAISASAQDAIIMMGSDGNISYWNAAAASIFGYAAEEVSGKALHQLLATERFHEDFRKGFSHFKNTGESPVIGKTLELEALRKNGEAFPVELSLSIVRIGNDWSAIGILRDITGRKRAEERLQESEGKLRSIYEGSNDAIMLLTQEGFTDCNTRTLEMFGLKSKDEFIGIHPSRLSPPLQPDGRDSLGAANEKIATAFESGANRFEWMHRRKSGEDFPAEVLLSAFDFQGKKILQATVRDISERKQAEKKMVLFRTLLDHSSDGIEVVDLRTLRLLDVNETECRDLGYSREELLSMSTTDIDPAHSPDMREMLRKQLQESGSARFETVHRRKDGTEFPVEISSKLIELDQHYVLNIVRDITERRQAAQAIEESERKFRAIIEATGDGILVADAATHKLVLGNLTICGMLGYRQDEIAQLGVADIHPPEALPDVQRQFERQLKGEIKTAPNLPVKRKDGSVFFADVSSLPMTLAGRPYLVGAFHDVTERKLAEEQIRQQQKLTTQIIETIPMRVFWKDRSLRYLGCNTAFARDAGENLPSNLVGKDDFHLAWREQAEIHRADDRLVMDTNTPKLSFDEPQTIATGEHVWLRTSKVPLHNDADEVMGVLGTYEDVSARKNTEIALRESEERFRMAFQTSAIGMALVGKDGRWLKVNDALCRIVGYPERELLGKTFQDITHPDDLLADLDLMAQLLAEKIDHYQMEKRYFHKDGHVVWVRLSVSLVRDAQGIPIHFVAQIEDITGDKLLEKQLKEQFESTVKTNRQLVELNEQLSQAQSQLLQSEKMASIGQLAAGVAHEINNPVGYVNSNFGTLKKYLDDIFAMLDKYGEAEAWMNCQGGEIEELRQFKKKIDLNYIREDIAALLAESREGIEHVKKIVLDLKDFSHTGAEEEWVWADIHQGLESTLGIVWNELKYKCEVRKEYGTLPQIHCLPSQLNQVFMNLLVNAAQAIEGHGVITIRTGEEKGQVWVEVADTGKGIPPENLPRIFEPFFTTKPVGKGTGLGLSVSYNIVKKHHGRIEAQSEPGKGAAFRVWLPLEQPGANGDAHAQVTAHETGN